MDVPLAFSSIEAVLGVAIEVMIEQEDLLMDTHNKADPESTQVVSIILIVSREEGLNGTILHYKVNHPLHKMNSK